MDDLLMRGIIFFIMIGIGGSLYNYISKNIQAELTWYNLIMPYLLGFALIVIGISNNLDVITAIGFILVAFTGLLMFGKMFGK